MKKRSLFLFHTYTQQDMHRFGKEQNVCWVVNVQLVLHQDPRFQICLDLKIKISAFYISYFFFFLNKYYLYHYLIYFTIYHCCIYHRRFIKGSLKKISLKLLFRQQWSDYGCSSFYSFFSRVIEFKVHEGSNHKRNDGLCMRNEKFGQIYHGLCYVIHYVLNRCRNV